MKSKLRNITINSILFKYLIQELHSERNGEYWTTTLRIFKDEYKQTPIEIIFRSADSYTGGNLLTSDVFITNEKLNLHKPSGIRKFIEERISLKWNWEKEKLEISDGMQVLETMGYDIEAFRVKI